jgi:type I restriction-modification system DNA methylase subunit
MKNNTVDAINKLLGVTESYQASDALLKIMFDKNKRESLFKEMLQLFEYDVSYDWFHEYFQDEHADRKNKKQDFTPNSVSKLLARIVGHGLTNYDGCAGTGGLTIVKWDVDRMKESPLTYLPSEHFYVCEELSDRTIPFLLFNLTIRGMNAVVLHGDVLSRKFKGVFFIQNEKDDHLHFSSLNVVPDSDGLRKFLMIYDYQNEYPDHVESMEMPKHVLRGGY